MTAPEITIRLVPWDDSRFLHQFERTREQVISEGLMINGPKAAERVEQLLRSGGYPDVTIDVERTVDEALDHRAHWIVKRDGRRRSGSR